MSYMSDVVPAMRGIPQPIIAAINGPAYGGGMCLTLGADLRYAAESAVFCSAGIINGLTSSELGATYLLPRAIGTVERGRAPVDRPQDRRDGSAARSASSRRWYPTREIVDLALDTAEEMTTSLSCFGVMMTKQTMWANLEINSLAAAIELENRNQLLAGYTGNLDEAIAAFREKRPPSTRSTPTALPTAARAVRRRADRRRRVAPRPPARTRHREARRRCRRRGPASRRCRP